MTADPVLTDDTLASAAALLSGKDYGLRALLDALEAATYVTDSDGLVIYANAACATFAGREPEPGVDRWCVTWKLYSRSGEFLPHEECPMAMAIKLKRPVRGVSALAERPDGTRVGFTPLPTPIFGRDRELIGAVNMLVPIEAEAA
ncbi:PAS domain-containing protein [Phenylobacterium sp.]|jgi:PAS domain-containing protein|uniref:PAS domain-containing protein n=1 Tax=Phenylobacterium sp. TaxID=1871053 RepID=UPI002F95B1CE